MHQVEYVSDRARLDELTSHGILDTAPEAGFDDIVALATEACEVPVALVSFVASDRQWFKARVGFEPCETDLDRSVCKFVLNEPDVLVIPDLSRDPRTAINPLVTDRPHIRFYAGAPLKTASGHVLGSLCVIDTAPRPEGLTRRQIEVLRNLARQIMTQLQLRRALAERLVFEQRIAASEAHWRGLFERLSEGFIVGEVVRDPTGKIVDWRYVEVNAAWGELVGIDPASATGRTIREVFPGIEDAWVDEFAAVVETGESITFTRQVGSLQRWYEGRSFRIAPERFATLFVEITERVKADARRNALLQLGDRLRDSTSVDEMTRTASEIVGNALGVTRAGFGRLDENFEFIDVEPDWTAAEAVSIAGRHRFEDYGDIRGHLIRGEPLVIEDVTTDPRTRHDPEPMRRLGICSLVNMPVRERGRTVAVFIVHDERPRVWAPEELGFLRNVADRVEAGSARLRAEAEQAILNQELSHRMKNTFAMVQAIAAQTLKTVTDRDAVAAFNERLHALSQAHDVLLQHAWSSAQLEEVATAVLSSFGRDDRIDIRGPSFTLGPRATLSLSLLLHEMATNALKYGALSGEAGRVTVSWEIAGEMDDELALRWRESGGPPATEPARRGFGSRLIRLGLVGTGGVALRYLPSGLEADFTAPVDEVRNS